MTIKDKLRLMAAIGKTNDRRAQEWAARRKERTDEKEISTGTKARSAGHFAGSGSCWR